MRSNIKIKLSVAGVILLGAFGYLAFAGMQKGWVYFVGVDQFLSDQQYATSQSRIRLHGKVATEGFDASAAALSAKFNLAGTSHQLPVVYRGAIPDMFQ